MDYTTDPQGTAAMLPSHGISVPSSPFDADDPLSVLVRRDPRLLLDLMYGDWETCCCRAWAEAASLLRGEDRESYTGKPCPPEPTQALPGTPEKAAVMSARISLGFDPFHPLDATWEKHGSRRGFRQTEHSANGGLTRNAVDNPAYRATATEGRQVGEELSQRAEVLAEREAERAAAKEARVKARGRNRRGEQA